MRLTLIALLLTFLGLPLLLLFDAAGHLPVETFGGLAAGVTAFGLMSLNLVLAARVRVLERALGGLDKLYFAHKWLGLSALVFIFLHETVDLEVKGQGATTGLSKTAAEAGDLVFVPLLVLGAISFLKRVPFLNFELPYAWWRLSHRFMGVIFAVGVFHQFFVKLPFDNSAMVSTYLTWMGLFSVCAFAWSQVAPLVQRRKYEVTSISRETGATVIQMTPIGPPLRRTAGQFVLLGFARTGLREPHPFTLSASPDDGVLEFSIKPLGDFTKRLRDTVEVGDKAFVRGAYGRFEGAKGSQRQIWLAGGIGITPFLSMADSLTTDGNADIDLIYCVRDRAEAVGLDRLEAVASRDSGFRLHVHTSVDAGRLDAEALLAMVDPAGASFWFCGPTALRKSILKGLAARGKSPKSVHFERFEFR